MKDIPGPKQIFKKVLEKTKYYSCKDEDKKLKALSLLSEFILNQLNEFLDSELLEMDSMHYFMFTEQMFEHFLEKEDICKKTKIYTPEDVLNYFRILQMGGIKYTENPFENLQAALQERASKDGSI